ncbi:hypothetical protein D3C75_1371940 [compost metagenome]
MTIRVGTPVISYFLASSVALLIWPLMAKESKVARNLSLSTPWVARNSAISFLSVSFLCSFWIASNTAA